MKMGRNEPCFCGSGKKYKKCCIDSPMRRVSNVNTIPIEDSISNFEYIEGNAEKLESIISRYSINDISVAVFCINSWAKNRSALAQALTLNQALSNTKSFGNKSIKEYSEFEKLFNEISPYLQITYMEDYTLSDFGQIKIKVFGEYYSVILGTGHEQVYATMSFISELADILDKREDVKAVFEYNSMVIDTLAKNNVIPSSDDYNIVYELPSEEYWKAVTYLFKSKEYSIQKDKVFKIMGYQKCPIEMRHFFVNKDKCYPLFNTSIVVDLYKKLLSIATVEEYQRHIKQTLEKLLESNFNSFENARSRVLIAPKIYDKRTGRPSTNNTLAFMTINKDRVLVAINKGSFDNDEIIDSEIRAFKLLHQSNQLQLRETYYRKELNGGYAFDTLAQMPVHFLLIEAFTDISTFGMLFNEQGDHFSCSALDMIYMLGFMDNFNEFIDFFDYDMKEKAQIMAFGGKSSLFFSWKSAHQQIATGAIEYDLISLSYGHADSYVYEYYTKNLANFPFNLNSSLFDNPLSWKVKPDDFEYSSFEHKGHQGLIGKGKKLVTRHFFF